MSISSVNSQMQSPQMRLLTDLTGNGLSADKASLISSEIDSVVKSKAGSGQTPPDPTDVRSAIEQQLSTDIASGKITEEDAATIRATLDQFEQQMSQSGGPGGAGGPPPGGPPPGDGGGAEASSSESGTTSSSATVESTTSSTANGVTTTVTTYSDGTKTTKVSYDSADSADAAAQSSLKTLQDMLKSFTSEDGDATATSAYLTKLLSSGLVNTVA